MLSFQLNCNGGWEQVYSQVDSKGRGRGDQYILYIMIKVEGVTGHTVITEFCGDKVTRWVPMISLMVVESSVGTKFYFHFIKQKSCLVG